MLPLPARRVMLPPAGRAAAALALLVLVASGCEREDEPNFDGILRTGASLYAQHKEEPVLRHFFRDRREGFFLDVGCYKWKELSTTYYLEHHLDWSGIAVDALADFRAGWKRNRPRSHFFQYVVTDHSGDEMVFYEAEGAEGVSSTSRQWVVDYFAQYFPGVKPDIREQRIPTIALDDLLAREGVGEIDLLTMDIEGGEPAALAGFDIERFQPELVLIEARGDNQPLVLDYFGRHGYERIEAYLEHDPLNWYFRPR
jgi:FkbM family methyltransferase